MVSQGELVLAHPAQDRDLGGHGYDLKKVLLTDTFSREKFPVRSSDDARRQLVAELATFLSEASKVFHRTGDEFMAALFEGPLS